MVKTFFYVMIIILMVTFSGDIYADTAHKGDAQHSENAHPTDAKHAHGEGGFTLWYIVYWAGLLTIIGLSAKFLQEAFNKGFTGVKVADQDLLLVLQLVVLGTLIYLIDQLGSMKYYHEHVFIGFIKFFVKVAAGMAMVVYSFSGLDEQSHH